MLSSRRNRPGQSLLLACVLPGSIPALRSQSHLQASSLFLLRRQGSLTCAFCRILLAPRNFWSAVPATRCRCQVTGDPNWGMGMFPICPIGDQRLDCVPTTWSTETTSQPAPCDFLENVLEFFCLTCEKLCPRLFQKKKRTLVFSSQKKSPENLFNVSFLMC